MAYKILVIEDDENIRELLEYNLTENGYQVHLAEDGNSGLALTETLFPDLILLDLMIPELDGIEVCKAIKNNHQMAQIPIIMLTAKSSETDKVLGLELGADDYMTKPFSVRELLARIKVAIRRNQKTSDQKTDIYWLDDLKIDVARHEVTRQDDVFHLTLKEFELLHVLVKHRGKVLTREFLLDAIWGYQYFGETRTVDVHIRYLRKKIETPDHHYIETIRGVGYKAK